YQAPNYRIDMFGTLMTLASSCTSSFSMRQFTKACGRCTPHLPDLILLKAGGTTGAQSNGALPVRNAFGLRRHLKASSRVARDSRAETRNILLQKQTDASLSRERHLPVG